MATVADRPPTIAATGEAKPTATDRLYSLDVFRGFTMIWMFSMAFGLHHVKERSLFGILPLAGIEQQFTHADWHGVFAWDMIQPFFMFIVGVAMPFSMNKRRAAGTSRWQEFRHVLWRCALLILLGTTARSISAGRPNLDVINVLGQLSFTYLAAYLVLDRGWKVQAAAAALLLSVHWAIYMFCTAPGVTGPYDKNANIGWWLDGFVFGKHWGGGYATINCISSAANTIFGVMAGFWLKSQTRADQKIKRLLLIGSAAIALGLAFDPIIPLIKKTWTASFAIFSTGITLWALALFYWVYDVKQWRKGSMFMAVVGMNSIFIYLFHEIMHSGMRFAGRAVFFKWAVDWWGAWGLALNECAVVAFQIYICYWLYKRRIFFKI